MLKIILLEFASLLSAPTADKTQYFVHLSFNSFLQLIKYFNETAIVSFFRIPLILSVSVFPYTLALSSKDLELYYDY